MPADADYLEAKKKTLKLPTSRPWFWNAEVPEA